MLVFFLQAVALSYSISGPLISGLLWPLVRRAIAGRLMSAIQDAWKLPVWADAGLISGVLDPGYCDRTNGGSSHRRRSQEIVTKLYGL